MLIRVPRKTYPANEGWNQIPMVQEKTLQRHWSKLLTPKPFQSSWKKHDACEIWFQKSIREQSITRSIKRRIWTRSWEVGRRRIWMRSWEVGWRQIWTRRMSEAATATEMDFSTTCICPCPDLGSRILVQTMRHRWVASTAMVVVLQIWLCSGGWIEDLMEEDIRIRCEKWQKFGAITIHIIVSGEWWGIVFGKEHDGRRITTYKMVSCGFIDSEELQLRYRFGRSDLGKCIFMS